MSKADVSTPSKCLKVLSHISFLQPPTHLPVLFAVETDLLPELVFLLIEGGVSVMVDVEVSDVSGETPVLHALDLSLEEVVVVRDLKEVMDPGRESGRGGLAGVDGLGEELLRIYPMSFSSCSLDVGRFVPGSTNEGGDDLSSSMGDEEGEVGVIVNETRGRRRRDCEGRWVDGDLLLDVSNLCFSQCILEAGSVKLRGEASKMETVINVGGVGSVEGADGDGGKLGRGDLSGECIDDGNGGARREGGVREFASGSEGFNVPFSDFGPKNRSLCPEGNWNRLWAWPTQHRRGVASGEVRVSRCEGSQTDDIVSNPDDGVSF